MRKLILYFVILLIAVWLGLKIAIDPGYVFIAYHTFSIEMTFWFFLFISALLFTALYIALGFVFTSRILPKRLQIWLHDRREHKAVHVTLLGLFKIMDGAFKQAERCLIKSSKLSPIPIINFWLGAYAAQQLKQFWKRDHYLSLAHKCNDKAKFSTSLIQVTLQIDAGQYEQALATLKHLHNLNHKHKIVLNLLKKLYLQLEDISALAKLIPTLKKYRVLNNDEFTKLEQQVYLTLSQDEANIETLWHTMPKQLTSSPAIVLNYAKYLLAKKEISLAEHVIVNALQKNWQPSLIDCYGTIISKKPIEQLAQAEKWLVAHPNDANLLLCLGRLCKRQTLWGKAKSYLEKSSALKPRPATFYELGAVMEAQNNMQAALEYYRKGVEGSV